MDVISTFCRMVMFPRRNYYFMNMSLHILRIITFERRKLIAHHDLSRAKIFSTISTKCVTNIYFSIQYKVSIVSRYVIIRMKG